MIKANKYFTDDELKVENAKIAEQYVGIWDYADTDLVKLERELEQLSVEEELYEDLVVKIKWVAAAFKLNQIFNNLMKEIIFILIWNILEQRIVKALKT